MYYFKISGTPHPLRWGEHIKKIFSIPEWIRCRKNDFSQCFFCSLGGRTLNAWAQANNFLFFGGALGNKFLIAGGSLTSCFFKSE